MSAVGTGSQPQTLARMNASAPPSAANPAPRSWREGGRIRALITSIPIATCMIILANFAVFFYELSDDDILGRQTVCVYPVQYRHQYTRLYANAWFHLSLFHILLNMLAVYRLCSTIENAMGTLTVLGQTAIFPLFVGVLYFLIESIASHATKDEKYLFTCAAGYSGVIFAFLIIELSLGMRQGNTTRMLFGRWQIPAWFYPIVILFAISLFMPSISFVGHLSGIIIGVLYVRGLMLIFTLPRTWLLALQRILPQWLKSRPGWRHVPEEDPFTPWYPAFCQSHECCPAPNMDNGCLQVVNLLAELLHLRRRQVSGYANGGRRAADRTQSRLVNPQRSASAAPVAVTAPTIAAVPPDGPVAAAPTSSAAGAPSTTASPPTLAVLSSPRSSSHSPMLRPDIERPPSPSRLTRPSGGGGSSSALMSAQDESGVEMGTGASIGGGDYARLASEEDAADLEAQRPSRSPTR